jgi:hypothetical protein
MRFDHWDDQQKVAQKGQWRRRQYEYCKYRLTPSSRTVCVQAQMVGQTSVECSCCEDHHATPDPPAKVGNSSEEMVFKMYTSSYLVHVEYTFRYVDAIHTGSCIVVHIFLMSMTA